MRCDCRACQRREVKPCTWPMEGGPPKYSSQPHHQLAVDKWEWSKSASQRLRRGRQAGYRGDVGFASDRQLFQFESGGK